MEIEDKRPKEQTDWKKDIIDKFSTYLDTLTSEDVQVLNNENTEPDCPDMFSFYAELAALKQELKLQNRNGLNSSVKGQGFIKNMGQNLPRTIIC